MYKILKEEKTCSKYSSETISFCFKPARKEERKKIGKESCPGNA